VLEVLSLTAPIFILICLGFIAVWTGLVDKVGIAALGKFVVMFALPALLFRALAERSLDEILNLHYLTVYGGASLLAMAIGALVARLWRHKSPQQSVFHGLGGAMSNSGFVGYPIVFQLFGTPGVVAVALAMVVETVLILPLALTAAEISAAGGKRRLLILGRALRRLVTNPLIIAIFAGLTCAFLEVKLPVFIARTVDLLASAAAAAALFVIGGILFGQKVGELVGDVFSIAAVKLVVHPLCVLAVLWIAPPFDPVMQSAAFLLACMPMASVFPLLGKIYGYESVCSGALVTATVLSFGSVSLAVWLVGAVGPVAAG
jgi:predicted permease